jgi:methylmalonyl-CoA mutase N-terminal domain/subunit
MAEAAIVADKLTKWFGPDDARTYAVRDASFEAYWDGSWYVESLTNQIEGKVQDAIRVKARDEMQSGEEHLSNAGDRRLGMSSNQRTEQGDELLRAYFEKLERPSTWSGLPTQPFYSPSDAAALDYRRDLNDPGEFPYTRGVHADMYRGRTLDQTRSVRLRAHTIN